MLSASCGKHRLSWLTAVASPELNTYLFFLKSEPRGCMKNDASSTHLGIDLIEVSNSNDFEVSFSDFLIFQEVLGNSNDGVTPVMT